MMNAVANLNVKETLTSLELVEQINIFRKEEGDRAELQHKTLLGIIRDEFEEEIGEQNILQSSYVNSQNKEQPMFVLTLNQAKQVLVRESKFVRKAIMKYIESLEQQLNDPTLLMSRALMMAQNTIIEANNKIETLKLEAKQYKEKADILDAVMEEDKYFSVAEASKMINIKGLGRNKLFAYLRVEGYLGKNNQPYQQYLEQELFKVVPTNKLDYFGNPITKTVISSKMIHKLIKTLKN